jgi:UDP-glucose 4-epimerase
LAHLLITGGAGFLGSHTCLELLLAGHSLVVLDDFSNSGPEALRRVAELAGLEGWQTLEEGDRWSTARSAPSRLSLRRGDVRSARDLALVFEEEEGIGGVLHFAGLKAVGESLRAPLRYWDVNVAGTLRLLQTMARAGCRTIVFSSSATIYGQPEAVPIPETAPVRPINPYGQSKAAVERMLADLAASEPDWRIARLRYFNPVGAHPSGRIGEDPCGTPTNLFPLLLQVAAGRRERLQVFGTDWPTSDGSGVRDFIHVMDLAEGHRAALDLLFAEEPQLLTVNLGSGRGHSVLEVVRSFEAVSGRSIAWVPEPRREGDSAVSIADPSAAQQRMGWSAKRSLGDICRDGWSWQQANPFGYRSGSISCGTGPGSIGEIGGYSLRIQ